MPLKSIRKIFYGLSILLLLVLLLPSAVFSTAPGVGEFTAVEVFYQEANALTPRAGAAAVADATVFPNNLPDATVILLIGGVVGPVDAATGEWQIGADLVKVYESAPTGTNPVTDTVISGAPILGDSVRVVGKRTLASGPIVAQYITRVTAADAGPAVVSTAYLFNGIVSGVVPSSKTLTQPLTVDAANFNVVPGYTVMHSMIGFMATDPVTVEFVASPAAPTAPVVTPNATSTAVTITWLDNAQDEDGYNIYRSTDGGATWTLLVSLGAGSNAYTDTGLTPGGSYMYKVEAFSARGKTGVTVTANIPVVLPAAPSNLTAAVFVNRVALSWTDNSDNEGGFKVYRSASETFGAAPLTTLSANTLTWEDSGLASGVKYFYRVDAYNVAGAAASNVVNATTQAPAPSPTPAPTQPAGGNNGGGGDGGDGGVVATTTPASGKVKLDGLTGDKELTVDVSGKSQDAITLQDTPKETSIEVKQADLTMKDSSGKAITSITMAVPAVAPPAPPKGAVVTTKEFGPTGSTFDPPITITLSFNPKDIPAGMTAQDLYIAWWDGSQWVKLNSTVDTANNKITAQVTHFTTFGVVGQSTVVAPPATTTAAPVQQPPATTTAAPATSAPAPVTSAAPTTTKAPAPVETTVTPAPVTSQAPVEPAPKSSSNVFLTVLIIAVLVVAGGAAVLLVRRAKKG